MIEEFEFEELACPFVQIDILQVRTHDLALLLVATAAGGVVGAAFGATAPDLTAVLLTCGLVDVQIASIRDNQYVCIASC